MSTIEPLPTLTADALPTLTADIVLLSTDQQILLIKRRKWPFADAWALPGGKMNLGESLEETARRELREETGVQGVALTQFRVYSNPERDPRGHFISTVYFACLDTNTINIRASDDAKEAQWFPLAALPTLAFDHAAVIDNLLQSRQALTHEQTERVFELVKLDYARLGTQEQSIIDGRLQIWVLFFAIVSGPAGYAGIVGLRGSMCVIALLPFFVSCLSLHMKHGEMVLRYDIRKNLKTIARQWHHHNNHDSKFSKAKQERRRWWHGWYRLAMAGVFLFAEAVDAAFVCWYLASYGLGNLAAGVAVGDALLIVITVLCMLF